MHLFRRCKIGQHHSKLLILKSFAIYLFKQTVNVCALEELVGQDSSNTNAWMMLGLARFDSKDIPGAEEAANTVLSIDSKVARAYLLRATILIEAKNRPAAAAEIQKYLDLEPNGPFADEAKALLKR